MRPEIDPPAIPVAAGERYRFDDIVVDAVAHTLERGGQPLAVEPKVFAALLVLLRHAGELVPRDDLLDVVWGHRHITPGVLTRAIAQLRDVLGDDAHHPRYIQTQHAVGYRFVGELIDDAPVAVEPEPSPKPVAATEVASSTVIPQPVPAMTHDHEPHHGAAWRWSWSGALVLVALLAILGWLDRRSTKAEVAKPAEASIAVLPFTTLSDDQKDGYFAEGLSTEMHSALSEVPAIKVAAWLPPQAIDRRLDMRALGSKLGVATILDATVRREGSRVRISARLSGTSDGTTLWAHTYERDSAAIFDTQSEIANEVARTLVGVLPDRGNALRQRLTPTRNLAAFDAYLQGIYQLLAKGKDESTVAADSFRRALTQDPQFARAQAGICRAEVKRFTTTTNTDAYTIATAACARAEKMEPNLGEVNLALAELHRAHGEIDKAVEYYVKAEIDPAQRPAAYVGMARVEAQRGKPESAMTYFKKALVLRPGDASIYANIGYHEYLAGDLPAAITSYRKATELGPDNPMWWATLGGIYTEAGDRAAAASALERAIAIKPDHFAFLNLGQLSYDVGQYAQAADLYRKGINLDPGDFRGWGMLADALHADPKTASEAHAAYEKAAALARRYLEVKASDAVAVAQLGWFDANLGQTVLARQSIARAEALGGKPGEVAMLNAQTLILLGDADEAKRRIAVARATGIPQNRIRANVMLGTLSSHRD